VKTIDNEYHFNLFKPTTEHGRKNRNIIITMVLIWFISVFGFQLLLVILQKPTPEKSLVQFETVWPGIRSGTADVQEQRTFINSLLAVYGKSTVKKSDREVLRQGVSAVVFGMVHDSEKVVLSGQINEFRSAREQLSKANDAQFSELQTSLIESKHRISSMLNERLGLIPDGLEATLLPYCLNDQGNQITPELEEALPAVMNLYLVHNQSVLTDTKFIGFPFHYFYTAEFLLILFVLLCLIYSYRIEALDKKYLTN